MNIISILFVTSLVVGLISAAAEVDSDAEEPGYSDAYVEIAILPTYPHKSVTAGHEGKVKISFTVSKPGYAKDARVISSDPSGVFDESALDALQYWRFFAARLGCFPVPQRAVQTFLFQHSDPDTPIRLEPLELEPITLTGEDGDLEAEWARIYSLDDPTLQMNMEPLKRQPAHYPRAMLRERKEGVVTLRVEIDEQGAVERAKVLDAEPADGFNRAAIQAVEKWQFAPKEKDGKPVSQRTCQTIRFRLELAR